jgi:hypothetical protein
MCHEGSLCHVSNRLLSSWYGIRKVRGRLGVYLFLNCFVIFFLISLKILNTEKKSVENRNYVWEDELNLIYFKKNCKKNGKKKKKIRVVIYNLTGLKRVWVRLKKIWIGLKRQKLEPNIIS